MELVRTDDFIEKLRRRDKEAVSYVIKTYHGSLLKAARSQRLSEESAEEVVAETWSVFFEKAENFEGRSHIRTYLFGIMFNKVRELRRGAKKLDFVEDPQDLLGSNFTKDGQWAYEPSAPDDFLKAMDLKGTLEGCLEGLTDSQRQVFYLKEVEGHKNGEICDMTELTMSNLKVTLHRARNQVRRCVEGKIAY